MTTDRTGPVLDLERLDAAADEALAGVRIDLGAVRATAAVERRRRGVVRRIAFVAVAAAVVLLVALMSGFAGALGMAPPEPAAPVSGVGALPTQVYAVPDALESVTRAPIGRVGVVLADTVKHAGWVVSTGEGLVLVSADGGQYRRLPSNLGAGAVSVSADGRVVAWADEAANGSFGVNPERPLAGTVRWVDVSTGRSGSASFGYAASQRPGVGRTALSPDGRTLFVQVWFGLGGGNAGAGTATTWVVDTRSGDVRRLCPRCDTDVAWDATGRPLLREGVTLPGTASGVLPDPGTFTALEQDSPASPRTLVSPDGTRRLVVAAEDGQGTDAAGPMRLVEVTAKGAVRTTVLGSAWDARLLAWQGDTAWVSVHPADDDRYVVRRVTLGTTRSEEVLGWGGPGAIPVDEGSGVAVYRVVALADEVVAGGRTVDTPPPVPAPWWSVDTVHLRLAGMLWVPLLVVVAGSLVVGVVLVRRAVRRSAR